MERHIELQSSAQLRPAPPSIPPPAAQSLNLLSLIPTVMKHLQRQITRSTFTPTSSFLAPENVKKLRLDSHLCTSAAPQRRSGAAGAFKRRRVLLIHSGESPQLQQLQLEEKH